MPHFVTSPVMVERIVEATMTASPQAPKIFTVSSSL